MNLLILAVIVIVAAVVVYVLLPEKEVEYKYAKPIHSAVMMLAKEISGCKTFEQLHAVESHFKKCCDYYCNHKDYHTFFTSVTSLIQERSMKIQMGMLAT